MNIDIGRLKNNLERIGNIGKCETGGISRLAFSSEYYEAASELKDLFEHNGLKVKVDSIGNLIGFREGKEENPSIMIGSHLDTVKNGGLFDGALGVFSALECIATLNDNNTITNHPIEIVVFNAEEGSEMGGTFGSRVLIGNQNLKEEKLSEKLSNYNLSIKDLEEAIIEPSKIKAFLELHIEQGGYLEKNNYIIGVVKGIVGITRYNITIRGEANHAGTTPMELRKDALTMAANLLVKIDQASHRIGTPFVSTVGQINVKPGAINVIPGEVNFTLEMRDMDRSHIEHLINEVTLYTESINDFQFELELLIDKPNVETDQLISSIIEGVCKDKRVLYDIMASGAGHDAKEFASKVPIGMIFVPSKGGKSHCPDEFTPWDDIKIGTEVLLETILRIDKI